MLIPLPLDAVRLLPSEIARRAGLNRDYVRSLRTEHLLQNHYFEAGLWGPPAKPGDDIHWGWEAPNSLVRGHFLGHWMSSAAHYRAVEGDRELGARLDQVVAELARCQKENGGEWVASIPERYLDRIARGRFTWASQYIVEKTLTGLLEAATVAGNEQALDVVARAARWFSHWTDQFDEAAMEAVLDYECGNMLGVWATLYGLTGEAEHRRLVERYDRRTLFDGLLKGEDVLTNRHANTTIPEVIGAAQAFEATGDERYRAVVEAYWEQAIATRGTFATGGQTSAEEWTPPGELASRRAGDNQEHCTVHNLRRLAEILLRWTGDARFADYRERTLHNGILAQQHPVTGMVTYYLPMRAGGTKTWSTPTDSFWCCMGTLVQAHAQHTAGLWYRDGDAVVACGLVPSAARITVDGRPVELHLTAEEPFARVPGRMHLERPVEHRRPGLERAWLSVEADGPVSLELRLRVPDWAAGAPRFSIGEATLDVSLSEGYATIARTWSPGEAVRAEFPRTLRTEPLPGDDELVAFVDGPVVLAGLCDDERRLHGDPVRPGTFVVPDDERALGTWRGGYRVRGQERGLRLVPLSSIADEPFTVYFPVGPAAGG